MTAQPHPPTPRRHRGTHAHELTARDRTLTLAGVLIVMLLGALDQTIVSTAMPRIIAQLNGLDLYAWVTTAYLLTSTVMVPIYGKLSDLYGRKLILIVGIVLFLGGSFLCGLAGEFGSLPLLGGGMVQLIVFRGLQGLGGAALFSSAFAVIADLFPPSERGKYAGLFGAVFGLASVLGPMIGGFLTDHGTTTVFGHVVAGWRWVFYVNLPIGIVALFMIAAKMPNLAHKGHGKIDFLGAGLLVAAVVPLLLALTWGGNTYAWGSTIILALFAVAAASTAAFIFVESRASEPILPTAMFRNRVFSVANAASFIIGAAFLGVVMFLPLFMQMVLGINATNSGFTLLPLMAGLIAASTIAGLLVTRTGRYKPFMIGGGIILLVGVYLLTTIDVHTTQAGLAWRMVIVGLGLGPAQSLFTLAIQNAVPMQEIGVATSASQFFRQIGSTIGIAVFGTVLTNTLTVEMPRQMPQVPGMQAQKADLGALQGGGSSDVTAKVRDAFDAQYATISRAVRGDAAAANAVANNAAAPESLKALVRDGGVPARVHDQIEAQASTVEAAIRSGRPQELEALASDPRTPAELKSRLAQVPAAALQDPQARAAIAAQAGAAIRAAEPAATAQAVRQTLAQVKSSLDAQAVKLAAQIQDGMKVAFANSLVRLFYVSLGIIALGFVVTLLIPEVPLRKTTAPGAAPAAAH